MENKSYYYSNTQKDPHYNNDTLFGSDSLACPAWGQADKKVVNVVYECHLISNDYDGHSAKVSTFVDLRVHSRDILERIGAEQIENQNVCVGITDSIC